MNRDKTVVDYVGKVKFLGFTFYQHKGKARVRIHPKSMEKMKSKIKEITSRSNGMGNESRIKKLKSYITGWVNYFKIADMKKVKLFIPVMEIIPIRNLIHLPDTSELCKQGIKPGRMNF